LSNNRGFVLGLIILIALAFIPSIKLHAGPVYNNSAFFPNGTEFSLYLNGTAYLENTTSGEVIINGSESISLRFSLASKRIDFSYIGWGGIIELPFEILPNRSEIPLPPLVAIKEGTNRVFFPQIIFDILENRTQVTDPMGLLSNLFMAGVSERIYVINPFYIPINVQEGDKIEYGFWDTQTDNGYISKAIIVGEESINTQAGTFNAWKVNVNFSDFSGIAYSIGSIIGVDVLRLLAESLETTEGQVELLLNSIKLLGSIYYDKASGWLLKANIGLYFNTESVDALENIEGEISGTLDLELINPGTVNVGGAGIFQRLTGLPDETLIGIDAAFIFIVLYIVLRRR